MNNCNEDHSGRCDSELKIFILRYKYRLSADLFWLVLATVARVWTLSSRLLTDFVGVLFLSWPKKSKVIQIRFMILIKFEICKRSYMFTNLLLDLLQLFLSQGQSILHLLNDLLLQIGIVILSGLSHLLDMLFLNKKNNP